MKAFTLNDAIKKRCKDPEFKELYDRELMINAIATMVVELRKYSKLTQKQLAKLAGTTQSVIARLEGGTDKRIPSLNLLVRIAEASDAKLNFSFVPNKKISSSKRSTKKGDESRAAA
jgi:transcriptional regulator with XRE-family HTH domain